MQLSPDGRTLIKSFEGLSLTAYPDANGYSIGYGHFGAQPGDVITREEADRLFDRDVSKYELGVSLATPKALPHEFDAMVSLAYNIGVKGFSDSTVTRRHNLGDRQGAADAFRLWNKSQGQVHQGLVKRREKERDIYLNGYSAPGTFPTPLPQQSVEPTWPPMAIAPELPAANAPGKSAYAGASVASLITLAFGWLVYRLMHR